MTSKIPPLVSSAPASATTAPPKQPIPPLAQASSSPVATPTLTVEGVMQRLRYFETLTEQYESYIKTLQAVIMRAGHAVPVGYFAALTGEGGNYKPDVS